MEKKTKKVLFVLPSMKGGGAERVASLLANEFFRRGYNTSFVLTSTDKKDVLRVDLDGRIPLMLLSEIPDAESLLSRSVRKCIRVISSALCKPFEVFGRPVPSGFAYLSFRSHYENEIRKLRSLLVKDPDMAVISFLQPSIPITVLAAKKLPNRIIISERGDPRRLMKNRYGRNFIKKYYQSVDAAVFQTYEAKDTYPECVSEKGTVISNPVKSDLPAPYFGRRNNYITTFCRISAQKNLPLLIKAFDKLHNDHPELKLRIIGDALNGEGKTVEKELREYVCMHKLSDSVIFEPFKANVHSEIVHDLMYVNTSDYEGISNAMLEAMSIGMPVVCTDCPIGGAAATIKNGENGLLVPVGDADAVYNAMKSIVEETGLAEKLSHNAAALRNELSLEKTAEKWMKLI